MEVVELSRWERARRVWLWLNRLGGPLSRAASTLAGMAVTLELPPATLRRIESEAARRGVSIDVVIAELAEALPAKEDPGEGPVRRRKLAISGIGASGGTRSARDADELLAEGFGRR